MKSMICNFRKKTAVLLLALVFVITLLPTNVQAASGNGTQETQTAVSVQSDIARPSVNGKLHVDGTNLVDESGEQVQLQGVSTHGLTWYSEYVNQELFDEVSTEWGANLIRLAMYSSEYVGGEDEQCYKLMEKGIEYAIQSDMYVLVDWHILDDSDPNINMDDAISFFNKISKEYADTPNVIYEICNEPNGDTTWEDVKGYAQCVIPVIKSHDPDAVIVVGTPDYDRDLDSAVADPITGYSNIMYTLHFYAASHKEELQDTLKRAVDAGLPVFITECGLSEASGDGEMSYENAAVWFSYLEEHQIPFAIWSLSNKDETSAMIRSAVFHSGYIKDKELTGYGKAVKTLLMEGPDALLTLAQVDDAHVPFLRLCRLHFPMVWLTLIITIVVILLIIGLFRRIRKKHKKHFTYNDYLEKDSSRAKDRQRMAGKFFLILGTICTLVYLCWRVIFSIPFLYGGLAVFFNLLLLLVEVIGFIESLIHYNGMIGLTEYPLPEVKDEDFPDVDIFIATYNEPEELLRKTINGCKHMQYPDKNKVHIYVCDDKRRASMRALAEELGVGYFDRPDNRGAKAGNLNAAMARTSSPYVVTFDADMIPRQEFLMRTIPYYMDAAAKNIPLGLIQTPQCFYTEDVFQHNLYAENNIPNEQDFFYRTIEPAKTGTNSVIYGGSNTILLRKAIEDIGGFYEESITEDFATGMLIESHGYVSLGLSEPLASGLAPASFEEHIQQRTRWGRGVILTAKKLRIMKNKNLSWGQKLSYMSSVTYWFSPLFNMVYLILPLLYALFRIPVFRCTWQELVIFWIPMFAAQNLCLRFISKGTVSGKWSGIQEMCVMPSLFLPILKETFGISLSTFKVTDKQQKAFKRTRNWKALIPFIVIAAAQGLAIGEVIWLAVVDRTPGLLILVFWLIRNLYFVAMSMFLVDGRDQDGENVKVKDAEMVTAINRNGESFDGVTTLLTEHSMKIFLDESQKLRLGEPVQIRMESADRELNLDGTVVNVNKSKRMQQTEVYTVEIMDFNGNQDEYVYSLYNRIPTLPQSLHRDLGLLPCLLRNFARHINS